MREKGQTEVAKTLETPVFSRGIEILTEKYKFSCIIIEVSLIGQITNAFTMSSMIMNNSNISVSSKELHCFYVSFFILGHAMKKLYDTFWLR